MYAHRFTPVKSVFWRWGQKSSAQFFFLHFALDKIAVVKTLFFLFWRLVLHEIRANVDFTNFLSSRYPLPPFFFYLLNATSVSADCHSLHLLVKVAKKLPRWDLHADHETPSDEPRCSADTDIDR